MDNNINTIDPHRYLSENGKNLALEIESKLQGLSVSLAKEILGSVMRSMEDNSKIIAN